MDYIFFIYGLSFILLAIVCHDMTTERSGDRPWRWLCLFGWLHGFSEWLDLLALSLGDAPVFQAVRLGMMTVSFMALMEFGRRGLRRDAGPAARNVLGSWLVPALALLGLLGVFSGSMNGLNVAFRYSLGLPGALMAGLALFRIPGGGNGAGSRIGTRLAAVALLLYAPATGLIVPAAPFPPADWLNHDAFSAAAGFPIQLVRALCAVGAMTGIWLHRQTARSRASRTSWVRWGVVAMAFILIAGLGWGAVEWRSRGIDAQARRELLQQAAAVARTLSPDRIKSLTFTPADRGTPVFERIQGGLVAYARYRGLQRICTFSLQGEEMVRGPAALTVNAPFQIALGRALKNPPPELAPVFHAGTPAIIGPRTTPFGTFLTAFAPVVEPRTGRVLVVVAVDRSYPEIETRIARLRLLTIGCTLALLLSLLGAIALYRRRERMPDPARSRLRHLETAMAAILGLALTAAATFLIAEAENREATNRFNRLASTRFEQIRHEMFAIKKNVALLGRFFEASHPVDQAEFSRLAAPAAGMDAVQAYGWVPMAPDPETPSACYPVCFVEPLEDNRTALGFDLGSEPVSRAALASAALTGLPTASDPIDLVQEPDRQQSILVFHPVFAGMAIGPERTDPGRTLRGFTLAAIRLPTLLERAAGESDTGDRQTGAHLIALSDDGPPRLLAAFSDAHCPHPPADANGGCPQRFDRVNIRPVFVFGRAYAVATHPTSDFYTGGALRMSTVTTGAGLLVTALVALFVGSLRNRQLFLDRQVKAQTRELREGMRLLRTLIDGLPDVVALQKPDHAILFYNRAGYEFLGLSPSEADGRRCFELIGRDHQCEGCATSRAFATGRIETSLRFVEGPDRWIEARAIPVPNDRGELTMAIEILRDVTENKKAEEALQESIALAERMAAEAARANTAKSEFLANMSHEIRTPMNGVLGMAGLMLDTELTPEQRQYAQVIQSSGETLLTLIDDILDFSKIEAGKLDLEMLDFDLRAVMEDFADALAFRAHQKNVEFHCLVRPDVPDRLRGDPGRLRQILNNLAGNAVKFTREGEISVIAERLRETDDGVLLRFSVYDTGIGIPEAVQTRLFTAFSQADGSTTRKYGGTGLGLAISKRLAELMGGEIGLDSVEGEGANFWFTVRFETPPGGEPGSRTTGAGEKAALAGIRVLVVDDNAVNRMVLTGLLNGWGVRHDAAPHADEAMALLREAFRAGDPFRAAILDMHMPDMDGEGLARTISADPDIGETRLILLTSLGRRDDARRMEGAGFSGFLNKPVKGSALFQCLAGAVLETGKIRRQPAPSFLPPQEERRRRGRILVVEDNITNQKVAMGMLRKLGYRADAAADGREAVKALETRPYDLVLMDCQMPEMDGFKATAVIRDPISTVRNPDVPVIALTAYAMKGDRERCLAAGMNDYLAKPISSRALLEMLEKWLPSKDKSIECKPSIESLPP